MIDTDVPGSPDEVAACASWLRDGLERGTARAADRAQAARRLSRGWDDDAGDAYRDYGRDLVTLADEHAARVDRAAGCCDGYAHRLRTCQRRMRGIRARARAGGLIVLGTDVLPPPTAGVGPAPLARGASADATAAHAEAVADHAAAVERVWLYDALAEECRVEHGDHADWIERHLGAAEEDARDTPDVDRATRWLLEAAGPFLMSAGLVFGQKRLLPRVAQGFADTAEDVRHEGARQRSLRRSGDPTRRATYDPSLARRLGREADALDGTGRLVVGAGRVVGPAGLAIDAYAGYEEVRSGESSTGRVIFTTATGVVVGGAVATALSPLAVTGAGGVVVAAGSAGAGLLASEGAGWVWDHGPDIVEDEKDGIVDAFKGWTRQTLGR